MCCKVEYMYSLYSVILFDIVVVMGKATNLLAGSNHSNCCRSMAFQEKNASQQCGAGCAIPGHHDDQFNEEGQLYQDHHHHDDRHDHHHHQYHDDINWV